MPTAMEMDLGEKEERAAVMEELRQPEMWNELGDAMRKIFLKWDKGEELTQDEQVKLRAQLLTLEDTKKRWKSTMMLQEKVQEA